MVDASAHNVPRQPRDASSAAVRATSLLERRNYRWATVNPRRRRRRLGPRSLHVAQLSGAFSVDRVAGSLSQRRFNGSATCSSTTQRHAHLVQKMYVNVSRLCWRTVGVRLLLHTQRVLEHTADDGYMSVPFCWFKSLVTYISLMPVTHSQNLVQETCTSRLVQETCVSCFLVQVFFLYTRILHKIEESSIRRKKLADTWPNLRDVIGRLDDLLFCYLRCLPLLFIICKFLVQELAWKFDAQHNSTTALHRHKEQNESPCMGYNCSALFEWS